MEGSTAAAVRKPAVEHGFECSRLEKALLARAYERLVPCIRRQVRHQGVRTPTPLHRHGSGERMHPVAKGG
jgi:hypothetical protein